MSIWPRMTFYDLREGVDIVVLEIHSFNWFQKSFVFMEL